MTKPHRDALLIIYFKIDVFIDELVLNWLETWKYIEKDYKGSWRCTGTGRDYVRSVIHG
jgi:hypothetical protein